MRRLLVSIALMLIVLTSVFGEDYSLLPAEYDEAVIKEGNVAASLCSVDLSGMVYATCDFRPNDTTPIENGAVINLIPVDGTTTAIGYVDLYWNIISSEPVTIRLKDGGKLASTENEGVLDWAVSSGSGESFKEYFNTETTSSEIGDQNIVDIGFEAGKGYCVGSMPLTITTGSYMGLPIESDYSSNLIVEITT